MKWTMPTDQNPVSVVHGDCLDVLDRMPDKSVDVVVTSPPYNQLGSRMPANSTGMFKGIKLVENVNTIGYPDDMEEPEYQAWLCQVVSECLRVSRGLVWVNHKIRARDGELIHPLHFLKFPLHSEVIWDRNGSMIMAGGRFATSHEVIYGFGVPHYWLDSTKTLMTVWRISQAREELGKDHPCPFPIAIPRRLIRATCPPGGTVLDPFAGSGTTGHASMLEGRKCVLIEKNEKYLPVIQRRIRSEGSTDYLIPNGKMP